MHQLRTNLTDCTRRSLLLNNNVLIIGGEYQLYNWLVFKHKTALTIWSSLLKSMAFTVDLLENGRETGGLIWSVHLRILLRKACVLWFLCSTKVSLWAGCEFCILKWQREKKHKHISAYNSHRPVPGERAQSSTKDIQMQRSLHIQAGVLIIADNSCCREWHLLSCRSLCCSEKRSHKRARWAQRGAGSIPRWQSVELHHWL